MTVAEARIFLSIQGDEDPIDAYEEQLFQFKQFFTTRPIIISTFQAKLKKLKNVEVAASVLGVELPPYERLSNESYVGNENILDSFQTYQKVKSAVFQKIHGARTIVELNAAVENLLGVHNQFSCLWPEVKNNAATVILSKELDAMAMLAEIKLLKAAGIETFSEMAKNLTTLSESILNESMRLFLVNQKEEEWKKLLKD
jgi:hypothetical protein